MRINVGISINLAGGGLENWNAQAFCQTEHVDAAVHASLRRLNRVVLIVYRRCGAGQIENEVNFDKQGKTDVVPHKFKPGVSG